MSSEVLSQASTPFCPMRTHISLEHPYHPYSGASISQKKVMGNDDKCEKRKWICQAPWIPPPGKTSSGQFLEVSNKQLYCQKIASPRNRSVDSKVCFNPTTLSETKNDLRHMRDSSEPANESSVPLTEFVPCRDSPEIEEVRRDIRMASSPSWWSEIGGILMEDLVHDVNNSVLRMVRSARALSEILEKLAFEGRHVSQYDIAGLSSPRDDLLLHAELAVKACRSMCRWLLRAEQQQQQQQETVTPQPPEKDSSAVPLLSRDRQLEVELQQVTAELESRQQQIAAQQAELARLSNMNASLESLKAHLQGQLRQKELECCRMSSRVHSLQTRVDKGQATLASRLQASEADNLQLHNTKKSLKQAVRLQKCRADRAEDALAQALLRIETEPRDAQVTALNHSHQVGCRQESGQSGLMPSTEVATPAPSADNRHQKVDVTMTAETREQLGNSTHQGDNHQQFVVEALHRQLAESRAERESLQRQADSQLVLLQAQLDQSNANNRVLRTYLAFLKRSYARVFQLDEAKQGCLEESPCASVAANGHVVPKDSAGGGGGGGVSECPAVANDDLVKSLLLDDKLVLVHQDSDDDDDDNEDDDLDSEDSCLTGNS